MQDPRPAVLPVARGSSSNSDDHSVMWSCSYLRSEGGGVTTTANLSCVTLYTSANAFKGTSLAISGGHTRPTGE